MKTCPRCGDEMKQRHFPDGGKRGWTCARCNRARVKAYYAERPDKRRAAMLWTHYRLRPEQFDALSAAQGDVCAACGRPGELVVDHDHSCCPGYRACGDCYRGLLCSPCNVAVGMAQDDPTVLRALAAYLEER